VALVAWAGRVGQQIVIVTGIRRRSAESASTSAKVCGRSLSGRGRLTTPLRSAAAEEADAIGIVDRLQPPELGEPGRGVAEGAN
jgi:hypothetical protein